MPLQVDTPSKSDIKEYFFNHFNWKGLNDDQNYLTTDQETFNDCNNVYVDTEGLLKSRPSLKIKTIKRNYIDDEENQQSVIMSNIVDVWTFERTTVYKSEIDGDYYLTFVNKDFPDNNVQELTHENIKLIIADLRIFIFSETDLNYYDTKTNEYASATRLIHIPVTTVIADGVVDKSAKVESPNLLTDSYYTTYLYSNSSSAAFSDLVGKTITVTIDGEDYAIDFVYNNQIVFVNRYCGLSEMTFSDDYMLGYNSANEGWIGTPLPFIQTSENNSNILCQYSYTEDNGIPNVIWDIYHTVDGVVFNKLPSINDVISFPKISEDGNYCIVFTDDGPYIISLIATEYDSNTQQLYKKYPDWQNLLQYIDVNNYTSLHMNEQNPISGGHFNQNICINGYFKSDTVFAFVYGKNVHNTGYAGIPTYSRLLCVYCNDENTYHSEYVFNTTITSTNAYTSNYVPNIHCSKGLNGDFRIAVRMLVSLASTGIYDLQWCAKNTSGTFYSYYNITSLGLYVRSPIKDACTSNDRFMFASIRVQDNQQWIRVNTYDIAYSQGTTTHSSYNYSLEYKDYSSEFYDECLIFGNTIPHLISNYGLYQYNGTQHSNESVPLIFNANPIAFWSKYNYLYVYTYDSETETGTLYATGNNVITVKELHEGENHFLLPSSDALLSNYYFSKDNLLYISSPTYNDDEEFEWYLPKINEQEFDYNITNLHPISDTEVAIFFEHSISVCSWDNDIKAYRYYKSRVQTGCKKGCDVLTTYDGKYILFTSERGLVGLTYQEFMATTEQTLSYLSDTIYDKFISYITESSSKNAIKLFKHAYWIVVYKQDSHDCLIFDVRNNSWWPLTSMYNIVKCIKYDDKPELLQHSNMYTLEVKETSYYDYDGNNKKEIPWFIQSQKLYLNAINYYKHIVNMTIISMRNDEEIADAIDNVDKSNYQLQINVYRDQMTGNIATDNFKSISYKVNIVRTYVIRLNYSKVNAFSYRLSYDNQSAIHLPLSLNNITVKYKLSSQVR